jgi:hypothetical protein
MASLVGQQLKDTYDSLLKTSDNDALSGTYKEITDGSGNGSNLYLGTGGKVGIGTNSPSKDLTINSATGGQLQFEYNTGGYLRIEADSGGGSYYAAAGLYHRFFTSGSERMRIDSSGTIQVRNQTPTIQLYNTDTSLSNQQTLGDLDWYQNDPSGSGVNVVAKIRGVNESSFQGQGALAFHVGASGSASEKVRIDSSGNVGIGASTVDDKIHVVGTSTKIQELGQTGITMKFNHGNNTSVNSDINIANIKSFVSSGSTGSEGGGLTFETKPTAGSATERVRISDNGNVGIGISPSKKLTVFGTGSGNATVQIEGEGGADPYINFLANNTQHWSLGVDDSDGDKFKLSKHSALGTNDYLVVDTSGRVGIGTGSPNSNHKAHIEAGSGNNTSLLVTTTDNADTAQVIIGHDEGLQGGLQLISDKTNSIAKIRVTNSSQFPLAFEVRGSDGTNERMRIDPSGNVLVGKDTSSLTTVGIELKADGNLIATRQGVVTSLNREDSDGTIADFRKDGTSVGVIGVASGQLFIANEAGSVDSGLLFGEAGTTARAIIPSRAEGTVVDNALDLGYASGRFKDIFATNGTIQTSDQNEKQDIEELDDAELRVAQQAKTLLRKYRWKSSVEEKGDDARIHFGIIAQDLEQAFTNEGLDAGRYGMFIKSTWTNEDGEEQTRLGVRYNQLLAFIISTI